jgi:hypothetical protein
MVTLGVALGFEADANPKGWMGAGVASLRLTTLPTEAPAALAIDPALLRASATAFAIA